MGEIIYKKRFCKEPIEEIEPAITNFTDNGHAPPFEEIMKEIYSGVSYLVLPQREKQAKAFIKAAIDLSNTYEVDIEIEEHFSHISVNYFFNCSAAMGFLKKIIQMADDITFFGHIKGYDIVLSLDYFTKAVFRNGRLIQPDWSDLSR